MVFGRVWHCSRYCSISVDRSSSQYDVLACSLRDFRPIQIDPAGSTDHPTRLIGSFSVLIRLWLFAGKSDSSTMIDDPRTPDSKNISYDFDMLSTDGEMFHFNGYQVIDPSIALRPWGTWKATWTPCDPHSSEGQLGCGTRGAAHHP